MLVLSVAFGPILRGSIDGGLGWGGVVKPL